MTQQDAREFHNNFIGRRREGFHRFRNQWLIVQQFSFAIINGGDKLNQQLKCESLDDRIVRFDLLRDGIEDLTVVEFVKLRVAKRSELIKVMERLEVRDTCTGMLMKNARLFSPSEQHQFPPTSASEQPSTLSQF